MATPLQLPEIAPVEGALIAVGIRAILSREVERVTRGQLRRADDLPRDVERLARGLVADELPRAKYSELNWRRALKELTDGWNVEQVAAMVSAFPVDYQATGSALLLKARDVVGELLNDFPTTKYQTLSGDVDLAPTDHKLFEFISRLEMIADPLNVFPLAQAGALLRSQAAVVRATYPTLSAAIDAAVLGAIINAKAARKSFELTPRAEYGLRAWFGESPIAASRIRGAQTVVTAANERAKNQQQPQPNAKLATKLETKTQAAEATR